VKPRQFDLPTNVKLHLSLQRREIEAKKAKDKLAKDSLSPLRALYKT